MFQCIFLHSRFPGSTKYGSLCSKIGAAARPSEKAATWCTCHVQIARAFDYVATTCVDHVVLKSLRLNTSWSAINVASSEMAKLNSCANKLLLIPRPTTQKWGLPKNGCPHLFMISIQPSLNASIHHAHWFAATQNMISFGIFFLFLGLRWKLAVRTWTKIF